MRVIPVISTKGGEGKSTQAANLAGFLADAGLKTLLIDGDYAQPTASSIFALRYEAPAGLYELLMHTVDLNYPDKIISHTVIDNLDLIISNDPHEQLKTAMLHASDGRMRLRNVLQHPLFSSYEAIIVDSQGARSVMLELILLSATDSAVAVVKPILPDVREFFRGTVGILEELLPLACYGIKVPQVKILINCMDYFALSRETLAQLNTIISEGKYSEHIDDIHISLLNTQIYTLEIYKLGHRIGQPVHRLETHTDRSSLPAAQTMYELACELFPQWRARFDDFMVTSAKAVS